MCGPHGVRAKSLGRTRSSGPDPSTTRTELSVTDVADPFDFPDEDGIISQRGFVVRTDFSDDQKWSSFCETILKSEREGMKDLLEANVEQGTSTTNNDDQGDSSSDEEDEEDNDRDGDVPMTDGVPETGSNEEDPGSDAFIFLDASKALPRSTGAIAPGDFNNATNLALLRLLNDVDIVPCLALPSGKKRIKGSLGQSPSVRLVDSHGFHEVYTGRLIWVYDAKSNSDGCARLITQRPNYYGLAT